MKSTDFVAKGINVSSRTIRGTAYIYLEDRMVFLSLNETGSYIWGLIDGRTTVEEIAKSCSQHFEGDEVEIGQAVYAFLEELFEEGMVAVSEVAFEGVMASA